MFIFILKTVAGGSRPVLMTSCLQNNYVGGQLMSRPRDAWDPQVEGGMVKLGAARGEVWEAWVG